VRDTRQNRKNFADTLIEVITSFLNMYDQFSPLNLGICNSIPTATDGAQEPIPELTVFPNPCSNQVSLLFPSLQEKLHLTPTDISGHVALVRNATNITEMKLQFDDLNAGFYVLTVQSSTGAYTKELLLLPHLGLACFRLGMNRILPIA